MENTYKVIAGDEVNSILAASMKFLSNDQRLCLIQCLNERTSVKVKKHWVCNECNFSDYNDSMSEDDVHELHCSNCGGWEFHLEETRED